MKPSLWKRYLSSKNGFYFWLKCKCHIEEGTRLPKWFLPISFVLNPVNFRLWLGCKYYDPFTDCYTINGYKFTAVFFYWLTQERVSTEWRRVICRGNKTISVEILPAPVVQAKVVHSTPTKEGHENG